LTTGSTAQARDVLEHLRNGTGHRADAQSEVHTVLEARFALLWCFERILVGRRSLTGQQKWNDTGVAPYNMIRPTPEGGANHNPLSTASTSSAQDRGNLRDEPCDRVRQPLRGGVAQLQLGEGPC
jgi:hypothetical protein